MDDTDQLTVDRVVALADAAYRSGRCVPLAGFRCEARPRYHCLLVAAYVEAAGLAEQVARGNSPQLTTDACRWLYGGGLRDCHLAGFFDGWDGRLRNAAYADPGYTEAYDAAARLRQLYPPQKVTLT